MNRGRNTYRDLVGAPVAGDPAPSRACAPARHGPWGWCAAAVAAGCA
ncbi:MAG: hypothetical protein RLZZ127_816, partial [Planctomycetota bacterium]